MLNKTEIKHWNNSDLFQNCFRVVSGSSSYLFAC